ncbi:MAG: radical SAM family heme chaperone HemW [Bacteroidota bacterium]
MAGIYIHIPFCKQACFYCDFHFSTNQQSKAEMVNAINQELFLRKDYLETEKVETIYFGGGTPSLLSKDEISDILSTIHENFQVKDNSEVTLEANPDDLSHKKLEKMYDCGINRLSIGVQSFDTEVLKSLNRAHNAEEAASCLIKAQKVGFQNISIDLIYGIPGRSNDQWIKDLDQATFYSPQHISAYGLTIEPHTIFGKWSNEGKFPKLDDDQSAQQFEIMLDYLRKAGFEQYEISNFSLPGFHSKHNSSYWQQKKYLGVGPSAHSYNGESRQFNINKNALYIKRINNGTIPATKESLSATDQVNEYLMTTLRTKWGSDITELRKKYDINLIERQSSYISDLRSRGYLQIKKDHLILTDKGKLLADKISADLFV